MDYLKTTKHKVCPMAHIKRKRGIKIGGFKDKIWRKHGVKHRFIYSHGSSVADTLIILFYNRQPGNPFARGEP